MNELHEVQLHMFHEHVARSKMEARTILRQFQFVESAPEFEKQRQTCICNQVGINLQNEGCDNLWEYCRKKRRSGAWAPKHGTAREFGNCVEYVDAWLFGDGLNSGETASPMTPGAPGLWWPVVVGLPCPPPTNLVFPYVCPALAPGRVRCGMFT